MVSKCATILAHAPIALTLSLELQVRVFLLIWAFQPSYLWRGHVIHVSCYVQIFLLQSGGIVQWANATGCVFPLMISQQHCQASGFFKGWNAARSCFRQIAGS